MNILITGGTGFIGTALCAHLSEENHSIIIKTRQAGFSNGKIKGINDLNQLSVDEKFDVVINLAGEPIANKRWSKKQRIKIVESRLSTTEELIVFFKRLTHKPNLFISGSAIGYYGVGSSNDVVDEDSSADDSFSSTLCASWEESALQAQSLGIRTCLLRTGIVLGNNGGALKKMLPAFKLGLGGKLGTGKQWMSWIHIKDLISIIDFCINDENVTGAINCTAPHPVTNAKFTEALGKSLNRPTRLHMPAVIIKLLMGDMGEELLLAGKKVLPIKIEKAGFQFNYKDIDSALSDVL